MLPGNLYLWISLSSIRNVMTTTTFQFRSRITFQEVFKKCHWSSRFDVIFLSECSGRNYVQGNFLPLQCQDRERFWAAVYIKWTWRFSVTSKHVETSLLSTNPLWKVIILSLSQSAADEVCKRNMEPEIRYNLIGLSLQEINSPLDSVADTVFIFHAKGSYLLAEWTERLHVSFATVAFASQRSIISPILWFLRVFAHFKFPQNVVLLSHLT